MIDKITKLQQAIKDKMIENFEGEKNNFESNFQKLIEDAKISKFIESKFSDTNVELINSLNDEFFELEISELIQNINHIDTRKLKNKDQKYEC